MKSSNKLPRLGFVYLDHVMRFFDCSNFKGWPDKIEQVVYHWGNDKQRFINEVKRKNIDVLIGNIPATAYETFRQISRELPQVKFIPSLDAQFSNKSKENVTHFCKKYKLPIPVTEVFYEIDDATSYLKQCKYPKIIKKSYGPSNYGGYFVHKVDSFKEAALLLSQKKYYPVYVQEFVPMIADIRVMLIGHKPVCAFWHRPPEGEWLTNTSQGGAIDYRNVPQRALDIAVQTSKSAKSEYWACDIALGNDGKYRILECATAFAAFSYIRDWIGQYLMWLLASNHFKKPYIPMLNWEELGKIDSRLLRTMRQISFSKPRFSEDCGDNLIQKNQELYQLLPIELRAFEEWPSEKWNFQDNYLSTASTNIYQQTLREKEYGLEEVESSRGSKNSPYIDISESELVSFFKSVKGLAINFVRRLLSI
jgi:glutathione synthase/RimK-type ligase-like ATP-grasp enzyme